MGDTKFRQHGRRTRQGPYRRDVQDRKRMEAEVRNEYFKGLSLELKREWVRTRPGNCTKQRRQLGMEAK